MITRIEYQSKDGKKTASVVRVMAQWFTYRRGPERRHSGAIVIPEGQACRTLIQAQALARQWVNR